MSERIPSFHLLLGDSFLVEEKRNEIIASIKNLFKGETAIHSFYLSDTPLDKVIEESQSLPFLAEAQVFILQEADKLKEKKLEAREAFFSKTSAFSWVIFEAQSLPKDHDLYRVIEKSGAVVSFDDRQKKTASHKLILDRLKVAHKTISPQALARLENQMGEEPAFLQSVLEQLISYSGSQGQISEDMVASFEEKWQEVDVFKFSDAVLGQKTSTAIALLHAMLEENGGDVMALIGLLHWQIRRFWLARTLLEEGSSESIICKKCRISPKQVPFFMRQLKSLSLSRLEQLLESLFQLDWKLKTGQTQGAVAMESWLSTPR